MDKQNKRISDLSARLYQASKEICILKHISWPVEVRQEFFKHKAQRLPEVQYPRFEPSNVLFQVAEIQSELGDSLVESPGASHC